MNLTASYVKFTAETSEFENSTRHHLEKTGALWSSDNQILSKVK